MNNQEAITLLRNLEDSLNSYCGLNEEGKTAFRMAIEALEKQIPMKLLPPEMGIDGRVITPCGYCGEELPKKAFYEYCPYCGQKIKR